MDLLKTKMRNNSYRSFLAFTLAEIISVIVILGIIAAITISSATRRTTERANRTRVAKAIETYDKFVQTFTIENQLNVNTSTLNKLGRYDKMTLPASVQRLSVYTKGLDIDSDEYREALARWTADIQAYNNEIASKECANVRKYFNVKGYYRHNGVTENKCIFKAGEMWWNMTNISTAVIAFKPEILIDDNIKKIAEDYDDNRAFYLFTTRNPNGAYVTNNTANMENLQELAIYRKAYDYAFNRKLEELMCNDTRTVSCVKSSDKTEMGDYRLAKIDNNGNYMYYYTRCTSQETKSCACRYKLTRIRPDMYNSNISRAVYRLENEEECNAYWEAHSYNGTRSVANCFYTGPVYSGNPINPLLNNKIGQMASGNTSDPDCEYSNRVHGGTYFD